MKQKTWHRMSLYTARDEWVWEKRVSEWLPEQCSPLYWGSWSPLRSWCDWWGCSPECQPMWVQGSSRSACLKGRVGEGEGVRENFAVKIWVVDILFYVMISGSYTGSFIIDSWRYKPSLDPLRWSDIIVQLNDLIRSERDVLRHDYRYGVKSNHLKR